MWIKKSIKNRFLSKKTSKRLISLLTWQLNCLHDDANDYIYYRAALEEMLEKYKKQTYLCEIVQSTLFQNTSTELDEFAAEIKFSEGVITLYDGLEILDLQLSLSRAAQALRKIYFTVWEIDHKGLKLVNR